MVLQQHIHIHITAPIPARSRFHSCITMPPRPRAGAWAPALFPRALPLQRKQNCYPPLTSQVTCAWPIGRKLMPKRCGRGGRRFEPG
jgi:hypothetical protein